MDYICVSEHSQCKELLVERWKISNLIRAETFTSLHFTSQDTIYTWCRNEFYRNDNACIDLHRFALPCFTFIWYFRSRMLLLTAALMVTAFTEVCRAETDQRYFPQETNWISEKVVSLYLPLTFTDHLYICPGVEQESHLTETTTHSGHWHSQVCYCVLSCLIIRQTRSHYDTDKVEVGGGERYISGQIDLSFLGCNDCRVCGYFIPTWLIWLEAKGFRLCLRPTLSANTADLNLVNRWPAPDTDTQSESQHEYFQ